MSATLDELRRPQEATAAPQPNVSRMASVGRTVSQAASPHPHPHHRRLAVVIAEGDLFDAALVALVEGAGYGATLVEPAQIHALRNPAVLLVRSTGMLALVQRAPMLRNVRVVFLGDGVAGRDHIRIAPRSPGAESTLRQALTAIMGPPEPSTPPAPENRVRVTEREREILQTYTLGSTLRETSQTHQIAESTVREHYRRVVRRYEEAGRPIGNKAQLLLEFMADGWVRP
ncbi:helix-turn-helix transcriptional regulator [Gordonia amicalis]|uniref:helix-turn-helix transcriptional regulator n=2 Tax=Gordonia amicalis TaxID=89053 RepID=UPI001574FD36|nr:helix-turn-helix transcriptional regulator [Gordonia amicalis]MBA5846730.1 helix-turn-helix transcriptional regulator [Gordonia amicalis]MDV7172423.1 helix-turn-helix transcriptional regulator [Gordonia amicalis]UOG20111.1 helix-turn-helix transcriptional regulator [Gordonia amicalis]